VASEYIDATVAYRKKPIIKLYYNKDFKKLRFHYDIKMYGIVLSTQLNKSCVPNAFALYYIFSDQVTAVISVLQLLHTFFAMPRAQRYIATCT
jgi:hypothetical protein